MKLRELRELLRGDLRRLEISDAARSPRTLMFAAPLVPRFAPVVLLRVAQWAWGRRMTRPIARLLALYNLTVFGLEVTPRCSIGPGLLLPHTSGTVIGALSIGSNVTVFQGVTLGVKFADLDFTAAVRTVVGDNVLIGAGAKVLGGIQIGNNVVISANSVVIEDVPDGAVMVGVPAVERKHR